MNVSLHSQNWSLAAIKLEFDVSEAPALLPKAKTRSWKVMMFKPILWGLSLRFSLGCRGRPWLGPVPGGAVPLTGPAGRRTQRP